MPNWFDLPPWHPQFAYTGARLLRDLYDGHGQRILDWLQTQPATISRFRWNPPRDSMPAWFFALIDKKLVLGINGVTSMSLARQFNAGYYMAPNPAGGIWNVNSWAIGVGDNIVTQPGFPGEDEWDQCYFWGWSAGGLCVEYLLWYLSEQTGWAGDHMNVCTLGSPKDVTDRSRHILSRCQSARWFNDGDPIPFWPPNLDQAPRTAVAWSFGAGNHNYVFWSHHATGLMLGEGGTITEGRNYPNHDTGEVDPALLGWATGGDAEAVTNHSIYEYQFRLSAAAREVLQPPVFQPLNRVPAQPVADQPVQIGGGHPEFIQPGGRPANVVGGIAPMPIGVVPSSSTKLYRAVKKDGSWWVLYEGGLAGDQGRTSIIKAASRSAAKTMANRLNRIVSLWWQARERNDPAFLGSIRDWTLNEQADIADAPLGLGV